MGKDSKKRRNIGSLGRNFSMLQSKPEEVTRSRQEIFAEVSGARRVFFDQSEMTHLMESILGMADRGGVKINQMDIISKLHVDVRREKRTVVLCSTWMFAFPFESLFGNTIERSLSFLRHGPRVTPGVHRLRFFMFSVGKATAKKEFGSVE